MRLYFSVETFSNWDIVFRAEDGSVLCHQTYQHTIQQHDTCYKSSIGQLDDRKFLEHSPLPFPRYSLFIGNTSMPIILEHVSTPPAPIVPVSNSPFNTTRVLFIGLVLFLFFYYLYSPQQRRKRIFAKKIDWSPARNKFWEAPKKTYFWTVLMDRAFQLHT